MTIFGSLFTPSATRAVRGALEQLVGEAWAMEPSHLHRFVERLAASVEGANVLEHEAARRAAFPVDEGPGYTVDGGVAVVPVRGVILRTVPGWFAWFDVSATSTVRTREALSAALDDPSVDGIVLAVDSPGGTVSGLQELADAVHAVRGKKPIVAQVDGLCASAAYWIASQADAIHATADSLSGSIGVYRVAYDYSRMLDAAGVRTNVISSHPLKGAGVFGAPLTDAQREDMQREINGFAALFRDAVQRGRGLSPEAVGAVATGQCWLALDAVALGLVDKVQTMQTTLSDARPKTGFGPSLGPATAAAPAAEDAPPAGDGGIDMTIKTATAGTPAPAASAPAAPAAGDEVARLAADNARLAAELELHRAATASLTAARRTDIIKRHQTAGRVLPAQMDLAERLAASYGDDLDGLDNALANLPVQVRDSAQGIAPGAQNTRAAAAAVTDAERKICSVFGTTPASLAASEEVVSIDLFTREAILSNGDRRPLKN